MSRTIGYVEFGLFDDMREEEWIGKVLWDKFGKVYFVL